MQKANERRTDMSNTVEYKGYTGEVCFSEEDRLLYGKVLGIRSLISFEGTTVAELISDFHEAVDSYLDSCAEENKTPEKPFKGSFNVRISPDLHRKAALKAMDQGISLNAFVENSLRKNAEQ